MLARNTDVVYQIGASEIQHLPSDPHHLSLSPSVCDVLTMIGVPFGTDPHPAKSLLSEYNKMTCTVYLVSTTLILHLKDIVEALTLPTLVPCFISRSAAITLPTVIRAIAPQTLPTTFQRGWQWQRLYFVVLHCNKINIYSTLLTFKRPTTPYGDL
jgi:hypothetical protein